MMESVYLGVDGGGSKTAFVLLDDTGLLLAETQTSTCYYFTEGIELVSRVLANGITDVCRRAGIETRDISQAFFGLPSYGEVSSDIKRLDSLPAEILGHDRFSCHNDMICGWAGSLACADGINVISGTGSMTYGERLGRGYRVGGWGELFGDEGSAYWIAVRGLNAFTRMSDGRLPRGPLYDLMKARAHIERDLELVDVVFNRWQGRRAPIADLAKTVVEANSMGDRVAGDILLDACDELALLVDATRVALGFDADDLVPVSYSGGVFTAEAIREEFEYALDELHPMYDLREPLFGPGVGAALYAAKQAGAPLSGSALARLGTNRMNDVEKDDIEKDIEFEKTLR
ncbi:N-acetylglucosamine kinase [Rhodococcus spongiicola]|uniref:N-acetylglucosamine kinase n=1 Tax=Rhodococcus spongiicola TaxID=2487352 RepID=A0A438AQT8_9NOCA|nr:BadF/BadG/BcrA/BcrD ATPase family protein [Rhodococcus spongiicola]RVW00901.1 N-acetylglucosamine kinase [Rhodococcus spongiicola]